MSFASEQIERIRPLWDRMLDHRFLTETRDGTLPDETFAVWMRQDYIFVEAATPFIATLVSKAPARYRARLASFLPALEKELEMFRERAEAVHVDLGSTPPSFTCHAYVQFLLATGYQRPFAEGFAVLYGAERSYHDSWKVVREGLDEGSPWWPFVENWSGEAFAGWVAWLEEVLEELAGEASPAQRTRMAELFELTTRYEIAFWEMAATGEGWPGIGEEEEIR